MLGLGGSATVDANNVVRLGTTVVGTRASSGMGTNELLINFQSNVTRDIAQQVAKAITFATTAGAVAGPRKVLVSVFDGSLFSPEVSKLVSVS